MTDEVKPPVPPVPPAPQPEAKPAAVPTQVNGRNTYVDRRYPLEKK